MLKRWFWITLIFLVAIFLRLYLLTDIPPGMTHDEADHGIDAWGVVNGIRPIYFTVGYGREPLFDYATAILMRVMGPTYFAGRLTSVFFSFILLAATFAWTRLAFNTRVALLTTAGLSVSFWGIMTSRHALRTVTMPAIFTLAIFFFWLRQKRSLSTNHRFLSTIISGLLLGLSFYTYMPARLTWGLLPLLLLFTLLFERALFKRIWGHTLSALLIMLSVSAPLLYHISTTDAEERLDHLRGPIDAALKFDFAPLLTNIKGSLLLFTVTGDTGPVSWRYNILERPFLTSIMGILFYAGLLIAIGYVVRRTAWRTATFFALAWLLVGLTPSLITGPEASTTRAIAMQPTLYLFPALTLEMLWRFVPKKGRGIAVLVAVVLFGSIGLDSARSYFIEWANEPNVRVHYETTRVETMNYLNNQGTGVAAISSPRPDQFHDPSIALMTLRNPDMQLRWFNGASSLLLPRSNESFIIFSGWADLGARLQGYLGELMPDQTVSMRENDLDRPVTIYKTDSAALADNLLKSRFTPLDAVQFGDHARLLGYEIDGTSVATMWEVIRPINNLTLFTHLSSALDQPPIVQRDQLDVPSHYWYEGDRFIQVHTLDTGNLSGTYLLLMGAYTRDDGLRLSVTQSGESLGDIFPLTSISLP